MIRRTWAFAPARDQRRLVGPGGGFDTHPHRDMEILTYVLSRSARAQGFDEEWRVIRAGELQTWQPEQALLTASQPVADRGGSFAANLDCPIKRGLQPRLREKTGSAVAGRPPETWGRVKTGPGRIDRDQPGRRPVLAK